MDPLFDGAQEGGLAVIPASDDQGDARGDAHPGDRPGVRRLDGDTEAFGRVERSGLVGGEGPVVHAGAAREGGAVSDEGDEAAWLELGA